MRNKGRAVAISLSMTVCVFAVMLAVGGTGYANTGSQYLPAFRTAYPAADGSRIDSCGLCHINPGGGGARNDYGLDWANGSIGNHTFNAALEAEDSDGDGFTNLEEITALTFPGDAADFPAPTAEDNTAPAVTTVVPDNNAVDVTVNTLVTATFSEAIDNTTVDGTSFFVSDGVGNVVGTVSVSPDNTTVTFTSSAFLADNTVYMATLTTDITDRAGNPLESDYTWSFTTGTFTDTTPPEVLSTAPDNNATAVALTATVSAVFDEGIDPATVDNTSFFVTDGVDNVVGTITVVDNTATFTPSAALAADTIFTATLTTAVTDLAGNPLADNVVWSFTTAVPPPPSDDGGGCSVTGAGSRWDNGAAIALLGLLAMFIALRFRKRKDRK
jgi:MYXO-CTERM domain-containing protein